MAALNFTKAENQDYWTATATVNADFNLHVERKDGGMISLDIKTVQTGEYTTSVRENA